MSKKCLNCGKFMWQSLDGDYVGCESCETSFDIADYEQRRHEESHYVWWDENDTPYITDKPATDTVKLSKAILY